MSSIRRDQSDDARELRNNVRSRLNQLDAEKNAQMVDDTIELARKAFSLPSNSESDRIDACLLLALSLTRRLNHHPDDSLLEEIISLERQALDLCSVGHPLRAHCCACLATSLSASCERAFDIHVLEEAICLEREALALRLEGHPERVESLTNLALSLVAQYRRTGDHHLLEEAINFQRKTLDLLPQDHPLRALSCGNLAVSLTMRYEHTRDDRIMEEVIDLQREALALCPEGHPDRGKSCMNLAGPLKMCYYRTRNVSLVEEAIRLAREALALCPKGHPLRATSCEILASSLAASFERTRDVRLWEEIIDLQREELSLRPDGHASRSMSCGNLALSLMAHYEVTHDPTLLRECFAITQEASKIAPVNSVWRHLIGLAWIHLQSTGPFFDINQAILYMSQSFKGEPNDILLFMVVLLACLDIIWSCGMEGKHIDAAVIYQRLVNLLPLLAHSAVDAHSQLWAMKHCSRIGPDAFVNAALAGNPKLGLENLDLAQGLIWSQMLHRRDPQLDNIPNHLSSKLKEILKDMAMESTSGGRTSLIQPDVQHAQSSQMYALVREIRALPGLDRFMLGEAFETLHTVAANHPVIVLVGARKHYYALIMDPLSAEPTLLALHLNAQDITALSLVDDSFRNNRGGTADDPERSRAMKIIRPPRSDPLSQRLSILWNKIVKPILDRLALKVSEETIKCFDIADLRIYSRHMVVFGLACTGILPASSALFLCTRRGSTRVQVPRGCPALTLLYLHTLPRSQPCCALSRH
jgi:hypothetical protein